MRILVTGAGGFLGRTLIPLLASGGHQIVAVSSQPEYELREGWRCSGIEYHGYLVTTVLTDDLLSCTDSLRDIEVAVNAGFPRTQDAPSLAAGLEFQTRLFLAALETGCRRVVNVSSQSVYPSAREYPAFETHSFGDDSPYAAAKCAVEFAANAILRDIEIVHLRLASLIGVGFEQRFVNKMIDQVLRGEDLSINGGAQMFDFMDVRDAAEAVALMCTASLTHSPEVVNVGSASPLSLVQIANQVTEVMSDDFARSSNVNLIPQESPPYSSVMDCGKLFGVYGFVPRYTLKDTVRAVALSKVGKR